jgi:SAM-dependent methyltransferase
MPTTAAQARTRAVARHIQAHWPSFAALYGLIVGLLLFLGLSLLRGWYGFLPFSVLAVLAVAYLLLFRLRATRRLYGPEGLQPVEVLYRLSQARSEDELACIDLGLRTTPMQIARRLTAGKLHVINVYDPESTPAASLRRARDMAPGSVSDPRLNWLDGRIDLLPLPDNSVSAVFLHEVLSQFWHDEERARLLRECRRILEPNGHLLLAERVRTRTNWLALGPEAIDLVDAETWRALIRSAGYEIKREEDLEGLILCLRDDKPRPSRGKQLSLELEFV